MTTEQPVTALSREEELNQEPLSDLQVRLLRKIVARTGEPTGREWVARLLATLDECEGRVDQAADRAVADYRASLAAEVGLRITGEQITAALASLAADRFGSARDEAYVRAAAEGMVAVLRLIEGDTDARER